MATDESTTDTGRFEVPEIVWQLLGNPKVVVALGTLIPIIVVVALGDRITPFDPLETNVANRYAGPGGEHILGTDHLGRDLLSRVILGGQSSLILGFSATGFSLALGVPIGLIAGYVKGRTDEILMRLMDIMMSIPVLLLGILIVVSLGSGLINVVIAVGVVFVPRIARVTRSATLSESEEPYIVAARARGESTIHILFRELLPNVTGPIIVEGSIRVGYAILIGTSLSFLGLGAGPPTPDWGFMVANAREHMFSSMWFLIWPSLALIMTITATNLLGDGLREVLDPQHEREL